MVTQQEASVEDAYRKVMASFYYRGHVDGTTMEQDVATLILAAANREASKSTIPMQEWVAQALERMQPIIDGSHLTGRYFEVEKEAMSGILERVEWLANHFKVMPKPCNHAPYCEVLDKECPGWRAGHREGTHMGGLAAMEELKRRLDDDNES